jgi:hypothetical protein
MTELQDKVEEIMISQDNLKQHVAEIILLRYKEAGVFHPSYDKEPLPVELEISEEIINTVLDAAIDEVRKIHTHNERSGAPRSVVMYSMDVLEAIEALKEMKNAGK